MRTQKEYSEGMAFKLRPEEGEGTTWGNLGLGLWKECWRLRLHLTEGPAVVLWGKGKGAAAAGTYKVKGE